MQIDTPQALYERPNNVFVGGFIGSPSMNFFDATVVSEDGNLMVDTGFARIEAPEQHKEAWGTAAGKLCAIGCAPRRYSRSSLYSS